MGQVNFIRKALKHGGFSEGLQRPNMWAALRSPYLHVVLGVQAVDEAGQAPQEAIRCSPLWQETENHINIVHRGRPAEAVESAQWEPLYCNLQPAMRFKPSQVGFTNLL